jgi:cell division protein FtsB
LNRFANTSWLNSRQGTQRITVQQLPAAVPFRQISLPVASSARRAIGFIPSWIFLAMILLAGIGICATVNLRAHSQLRSAETQFNQMSTDIELIRKSNVALQLEIRRITTEPAMIESAARARLGMVRPTDIIVPIESGSRTNLATLSFVR